MDVQEELTKEKKKVRDQIELEKDSIQYNKQDLDQEQKVDVNPTQLNSQNLHIFMCNDKNDYAGKISGITYLERNKEIAMNVEIFLYFGHERSQPVFKTNSDNNGNFVIEDIPPGYYTIYAQLGESLRYQSHYIKVFSGQNVYHAILLK